MKRREPAMMIPSRTWRKPLEISPGREARKRMPTIAAG
jgi:hypothetical protein